MRKASWFRLGRVFGLAYMIWASIRNIPLNIPVALAWIVMTLVCYLSQEIGRLDEIRYHQATRNTGWKIRG